MRLVDDEEPAPALGRIRRPVRPEGEVAPSPVGCSPRRREDARPDVGTQGRSSPLPDRRSRCARRSASAANRRTKEVLPAPGSPVIKTGPCADGAEAADRRVSSALAGWRPDGRSHHGSPGCRSRWRVVIRLHRRAGSLLSRSHRHIRPWQTVPWEKTGASLRSSLPIDRWGEAPVLRASVREETCRSTPGDAPEVLRGFGFW